MNTSILFKSSLLFLLLLSLNIKGQSTATDFPQGAAVIDMGITPQTANNGLKPYGLVYALVSEGIPVNWIIKPTKSFVNSTQKVDQTDLIVSGKTTRYGNNSTGNKQLKSGPFIIAKEYISTAGPIIESWVNNYPGLTVYWQLDAIVDAPVRGVITSFPNIVIYPKDGDMNSNKDTDIEKGFYNRAGLENSGIFRLGMPSDLNECDQFYVLSHHSDPESNWNQSQVNILYDFVTDGGNVWMGCHDVSVSEGLETSGKAHAKLNFLSTDGLMPYSLTSSSFYHPTGPIHDNTFSNNNVAYTPSTAPDPIMQFMGEIHPALNGNSEKIYLPKLSGDWRNSTSIGFYDPQHPDIPGNSNGPAAIVA